MEQTFYCQSCRARLILVRGESENAGDRRPEPWQLSALNASVFDSGKIDESFIVLDDRRPPGAAAGPAAARELAESFVVLPGAASSVLRPNPSAAAGGSSSRDAQAAVAAAGAAGALTPGPPGGSGVLLQQQQQQQQYSSSSVSSIPAAAAAMGPMGPTMGPTGPPPGSSSTAAAMAAVVAAATADRSSSASAVAAGSSGGGPISSSSGRATGGGLDAKLETLASLCELASTVTGVDHPLCLDCVAQLKEEVEAQIAELQSEITAYSAAVQQLGEGAAAVSQEEFDQEMAALAAQTAAARQEQHDAESALTAVSREAAAQQAIAADIAALEERYWHDLNEYQLSLQQHISDRDSLLNKIDRAGQQLLLLKSTNVLNDTFRIWHDGPFGTISGFRLGRTPECPVEWDEINAAWGQAVLLLHTMAQQCKLNFLAYRLLPMGSHPRVADKRGTYDLFGPVNKLWGSAYDKAMAVYLACLKEFGDFARARDISEGQANVFEFPFAIEGDKVGNYTIKLSMLNKDTKWTKALKLMLADLKVVLQWMIQRDMAGQHTAPTLPSLAQEGPTHSNVAA